jgi:capsular polysaccharide biosynthesis protein
MEKRNQETVGETVISMEKIIANIKAFWWICLITVALSAAFVGYQTVKTFRVNQSAQYKDSYVGSAVLYLSSENDKDMRAYAAILSSTDTKERLTEALEAAGMTEFSSSTDKLSIASQSDSTAFGLTVLSIGQERTRILLDQVTQIVLEQAAQVMGVEADIISSGVVNPCLWYTDGSFRTLSDESQRIVTLSASDFLSWKKIIIVCAGAFLGIAAIFVAILFDDKVRSSAELEKALELPYLGQWKGKNQGETAELMFALKGYLSAPDLGDNQKGVVLLSLKEQPDMAELRQACEEALQRPVAAGRKNGEDLTILETARESAGVILVVSLNHDKLNEIKTLKNQLQVAQIPVLGSMVD